MEDSPEVCLDGSAVRLYCHQLFPQFEASWAEIEIFAGCQEEVLIYPGIEIRCLSLVLSPGIKEFAVCFRKVRPGVALPGVAIVN